MNWQGVGAALAARANPARRTPRVPGDELSAYLDRSASSAVQSLFQAGIRAAQEADGTSAAVVAAALLLEALTPIEKVMRPVAFAARAAEPSLVAAVVAVLSWLEKAHATWTEPSSWEVSAAGEPSPSEDATQPHPAGGGAEEPGDRLERWKQAAQSAAASGSEVLASYAKTIGVDVESVLADGGRTVVAALASRQAEVRAPEVAKQVREAADDAAAAKARLGLNEARQHVVDIPVLPWTASVLHAG